jgi:hypothetical protein
MTSQLLEGIGVISSLDSKKATYQESVTAHLGREHDDEDIPQANDADPQSSVDSPTGALSAIQKVSHFCDVWCNTAHVFKQPAS